jgi:hypothetical protein
MKVQYTFNKILLLVYLVLLGLIPVSGFSQETSSCAENFRNAQSLFNRGQVEQIPSILSGCLKSGFTREESLAAYKLLIQTYLFEDKLQLADSAMLAFLKKYPEYELSPTDHSSFVYLFNNFNVKPVVQISYHIGTNIPYLTFINPVSVSGEPVEGNYSSELLNLYTSFEAKFEINKKMEINIEAAYSQLSFTSTEQITDPDKGTTTYTELQRRIELPVSVTYNLKNHGKFTPYGRLGLGPALLLGSTATADFNPADINGTSHTGPELKRDASRITLDIFGQAGAGIKYKTNGGFLFAELRSNFGFLNQVTGEGCSPEEQELANYYYYADDDFHLNALNFTLGYTQIFYKPSKKNKSK